MGGAALRTWCLGFGIAAACPGIARAQAWLPAQGEGSIAITYEGMYSRDHLDTDGRTRDKGHVTRHLLVAGFDFGLTDRWSVGASATAAAARHTGLDAGHGPLDNGLHHGTVQDVRLTLAYQVPTHTGWAIAPYVGGLLPSHAYETRGHSAFGRRLKSLLAGAWVGRDLDSVLPHTHVQAHYAFSFVAPIQGLRVNRSTIDLEAGYSPTRSVTLTMATAFQKSHGGLEFPLSHEAIDDLFDFHDRVARDDYLLFSAGVSIAVGRRTVVYGSVAQTVWGRNTHKIIGGTFGLSVTFGGGLSLSHP